MRPGLPIRLITATLITVIVAAVVVGLMMATDTMLSIWQRLNELAPWASAVYLVLLVVIALLTAWFAFSLVTGGKSKPRTDEASLDRDDLQARIDHLETEGVSAVAATRELNELDRRRESGQLYLALFGEISSGKSSLINALVPQAHQLTGTTGGTTTDAQYFEWQPDQGPALRLVDLPGFSQAGANSTSLTELARDEALRAHVVIYVCDGDLNRVQHARLAALAALQKPVIVALNKSDYFDDSELAAIQTRLRESVGDAALAVVAVQSGGQDVVRVIDPDGTESQQVRPRPPQVAALVSEISSIVTGNRLGLEEKHHLGALALTASRLSELERNFRSSRAESLVEKYSRRAMIGALAAITPGSDLVIQGVLATRLMHELCALYQVSVRDVDLDQFLTLAGSKLKRTTSLVLAVVGNGLKAFPGIGTVAGGLVHAVAYGMIFDSLGRSVAAALEQSNHFKPALLADRFEEQLVGTMESRAGHFVRLALTQLKNSKD